MFNILNYYMMINHFNINYNIIITLKHMIYVMNHKMKIHVN